VCWSGVFPAISILLKSMGLFSSVFLRFACAAVVLLALLWLRERRLPRLSPRELVMVVGLGLLGITFYNTMFTAGLALVEASRAALIVPTNPAFTALFAALLLRERLGRTRALGIALCVAGALWTLARGELRSFAQLQFGVGELILVLCIFMWTAYTLLGRIALSTLSPLALTSYVMVAGTIPLALPASLEGAPLSRVTWEGWAAFGYLVVFGTVIPFLWFYEGVKALGAARASQWINVVPPLAVLESVWLLDEPFPPSLLAGMALVVLGLYFTNKPRKAKKGSEQFSGR
jgi:drug/metabolite transporter (DMT)-like permease